MTAEVAILNKTVVAVAADSAVTVGGTKVHRSSTKIFAISADIGAMIHGYSDLAGMSWEVLLKLFRQKHGQNSFATVDDCYSAIHKFLSEANFPWDSGSSESLITFSIEVVEYVRARVENLEEAERSLGNVTAIIDKEIKEYTELTGEIDFACPDLPTFQRDARDIVESVVENIFEDEEYEVPKDLLPKFGELVHAALKSTYLSDNASGLVIFGFGKDELFPQLVQYAFDGAPFGNLRTVFIRKVNVVDNGPTIVPFAAREVMDSIIQGIVVNLKEFYVESISVIANEVARRVIEDNLNSQDHLVATKIAERLISKLVDDFRQASDAYVRETYVHPMIDIIKNMPKDEVAVLAEALVEVTALRIKASKAVESVAEPVDVCVVTKGDGLIWIKRKHYFDLSKNLQYL